MKLLKQKEEILAVSMLGALFIAKGKIDASLDGSDKHGDSLRSLIRMAWEDDRLRPVVWAVVAILLLAAVVGLWIVIRRHVKRDKFV